MKNKDILLTAIVSETLNEMRQGNELYTSTLSEEPHHIENMQVYQFEKKM